MITLLILGGNGFIGKNLREYFSQMNDYQVLSPARQELNLLSDIDCEIYIKKNKPDIVIHAAVDITSAERTLQMFFNVFNQRKYFGELIQIGSGAEYDKRAYHPLIKESYFGSSIPVDTYGISKYLISREMESARYGLNLRVFGIFGPHENYHRRFISNNICRILAGLPVSINRDMYFDYIDVGDLAKFIDLIIKRIPLSDVSYNFCSGKPLLLSEIARLIIDEMDCSHEPIILNPGFNQEYSGNSQKIFDEAGVFEFTPIRNSINRLVDFYRLNLDKERMMQFRKDSNA